MNSVDYLIVGSGLTGGTIARLLADSGREVLVVERRSHLGGNVHDFLHPSNIRVHTYGPHYFRCSSDRIWDFVRRFARFIPYDATVKTSVGGRLEEWPVNRKLFQAHPGWEQQRPSGQPANFEEACLVKMPRRLYQDFVCGYTRRQWGMEPCVLDARLATRVRINGDHETTLTPRHRHQGLPEAGYAAFMTNLLHGVPHVLGADYLQCRGDYQARKALIFTGPIDQFFGFDQGRLAYRGQRRTHEFLPGIGHYQPCAQVNYPDATDHGPIRSIEWKYLMTEAVQRRLSGTVVTREFPFSPVDPDQFEYPMPMPRFREVYNSYRRRALGLDKLIICGRLGEYRYFDMDHAIGRAMLIAGKILSADHHSVS